MESKTKRRESAQELENLLIKYVKEDKDVGLLYSSLKPFLEKAKIDGFMEYSDRRAIPGSRLIAESNLPKYVDLMNAYSKFKFAISDGDAPHTQAVLKIVKEIREKN